MSVGCFQSVLLFPVVLPEPLSCPACNQMRIMDAEPVEGGEEPVNDTQSLTTAPSGCRSNVNLGGPV